MKSKTTLFSTLLHIMSCEKTILRKLTNGPAIYAKILVHFAFR